MKQIYFALFICILGMFLLGCTTAPPVQLDPNNDYYKINNSLHRTELEEYNDSFDEFDEDKWEKIISTW